MVEEQRWNPGRAAADRAIGGTALTLEHDDGGNTVPDAGSVSVRLTDTGELPFLQPRPGEVAVDTGPGWVERLSDLGRRPATIFTGAIIAGLILAAIGTRVDQGGPSSNEGASSARPAIGNPGSDVDAERPVDGVSAEDGVVLESSAVDGGAGETGQTARSSGDAFEADDGGVLTVQVVEPAEAVTNPTATARSTTATPTTAAPTTAEPSAPTTEATTSTIAPFTTEAASTTAPPTTAEATTTTAEPTTTTTDDVVAEADGVSVKALGPGSTDGGNAPAIRPGDIILRAEGSEDIIAYRFRIYIQDDGEWERVESSGWRLRRQFDTRFRRYGGRTIRWTVEGRTLDGTRTPTTPPLHIYVDSGRDFDDDD